MDLANRFLGMFRAFADTSLVSQLSTLAVRSQAGNWIWNVLRFICLTLLMYILLTAGADFLAYLFSPLRKEVVIFADLPSTNQFDSAVDLQKNITTTTGIRRYFPFFGNGIEKVTVKETGGTQDNLLRLINSKKGLSPPPTCAIVVDSFASQDSPDLRLLAPFRTEMLLVIAKKKLLNEILKGNPTPTGAVSFEDLIRKPIQQPLSFPIRLAVGRKDTLQRRLAGEMLELVCPPNADRLNDGKAGGENDWFDAANDKAALLAGQNGFVLDEENPSYDKKDFFNKTASPKLRYDSFPDILFLTTGVENRLLYDMAWSGEWEVVDCASVLSGYTLTHEGYSILEVDEKTYGLAPITTADSQNSTGRTTTKPDSTASPAEKANASTELLNSRPFVPSKIKVLALRKVLACTDSMDGWTAQSIALAAASAWSKKVDLSERSQKLRPANPDGQNDGNRFNLLVTPTKSVLPLHPAVKQLENGNRYSPWTASFSSMTFLLSLFSSILLSTPIVRFASGRLDAYLQSLDETEARLAWENFRKSHGNTPETSSASESLIHLVKELRDTKLSEILNVDCRLSLRPLQIEMIEQLTQSIELWGRREAAAVKRGCQQIFDEVVDLGKIVSIRRSDRTHAERKSSKLINSLHLKSDITQKRIWEMLDLIKTLPLHAVTPGLRRLDTICEELLRWMAAKLRRVARRCPSDATNDLVVDKLASDMSHAMSVLRKGLPANSIQSMPDPVLTWKESVLLKRGRPKRDNSKYAQLSKKVALACKKAERLTWGKPREKFLVETWPKLKLEIQQAHSSGMLTTIGSNTLRERLDEYFICKAGAGDVPDSEMDSETTANTQAQATSKRPKPRTKSTGNRK
ncbi:hypothetical protein [Planctopirus hydrillae]|uniref:Uncharacterized protein n=1 Tax=Planctopirus hydrillae TaxID=1841610 RepID=A0A1C3ETG3_9PLAN|nr:hypothetical protein [Planctopirus hydrillae]ODA36617.1 hypothetical protein A6X21_15915 [Planctopirus hydrillae]